MRSRTPDARRPSVEKEITRDVLIRDTKPAIVKKIDDGNIGFNVDGRSYVTVDLVSAARFLDWLCEANEAAPKKRAYGDPTAVFRCCN